MKKTKRFLALLLSLTMVFTLLGGTVSMADESSDESSDVETTVTDSGECGEEVTWSLKDGALTISGTGEIWYYDDNCSPWFDYIDEITEIVIEDGITYIPSWIFDDCVYVETISIPASVTVIGSNAFWCVGDATETGYFTIYYAGTADQWNSIDIDYDERLAYGLALVYDSEGTCINWEELSVGEASSSGTIKYSTGYKLWYTFTCTESGYYVISVESSDGQGTYLALYDENRSWLYDAWGNWDGRNENATMLYYYEAGQTYIIEAGDMNQDEEYDITVTISALTGLSDGYDETVTIDTAGDVAFFTFTPEETGAYYFDVYGDGDTYAVLNSDYENRLTEDDDALDDENARISYMLEEGETYIYVAYFEDSSVTGDLDVVFGAYETSGQCGDSLYWSFDAESNTLTISGSGEMWNFDTEDYDWSAPWYSLRDWIYTIKIEDGVTSIGDVAFANCYNVDSITIPSSVTSVGYAILRGTGIDSITFEGDAPAFNEGTFEDVVATVYYPADDESWESYWDEDGNWIEAKQDYWGTITWASVDEDGNISVDEDGLSGQCGDYLYWSLDLETGTLSITGRGEMWDVGQGYAYWYALRDYITSVKISEKCTSIGDSTFYNLTNITEITIPESVIYIGWGAFQECTSLETVSILSEKLTYIYDYAFFRCYALSEINIPDGVYSIGYQAFYDCYALTEIDLPETLTYISGEAFEYSGLTSIVIPDSVISIGDGAFAWCSDLAEATIGEGLTYIPAWVFQGTALVDVVIPDSVEDIYNSAFADIDTLESVVIGENVSYIADYAFGNSGTQEDVEVEYTWMYYSELDEYGNYVEDSLVESDLYAWDYNYGRTLTVTFTGDAIVGQDEWGYYLNMEGIFGNDYYVTVYYYADSADDAWVGFAQRVSDEKGDFNLYIDDVEAYQCWQYNASYISYVHANHDMSDGEVVEEATCTEDGTLAYTCSICGLSDEETIEATGHSYELEWTWADDYSTATATFTCSACGDEETVTATVASAITAATCTEDGEEVYTATAEFEDETYTDTVTITNAATGHSYKSVVTAASCVNKGYTTYTCTVCGYSYTSDVTAKIDHSYGNATWTWTQTDSSVSAQASWTCSECTKTYTADAQITSVENSDGTVTYTATVTGPDDKTYTDTMTGAAVTTPDDEDTEDGSGTDTDEDGDKQDTGSDSEDTGSGDGSDDTGSGDGSDDTTSGDGTVLGGLNYDSKSATWYYYTDGAVDTSYTGLVSNSYGWWYVEDGVVTLDYTGLVTNSYGTWLVVNSNVKFVTGLYLIDGTWYYISEGAVDYDYTGLAENLYGTWYVEEGVVDFGYTGFIEVDGATYYAYKNLVSMETGLYKINGTWYYLVDGAVAYDYTGTADNSYGTWYVEEGVVDFGYTGFLTVDEDLYYVFNNLLSYATGLYRVEGTWYYFVEGVIAEDYTGLATNAYGTWYVEEGVVDFGYTGTVTINGTEYTIYNNLVIS